LDTEEKNPASRICRTVPRLHKLRGSRLRVLRVGTGAFETPGSEALKKAAAG
jgi:hypothetical protein